MTATGSSNIRELDAVLPLATDEDHIVTGYRMVRQDPFFRRLNAKLFGARWCPILLNVRVKDLNCAFKLIPRKVLQAIRLDSTGALINAELYAAPCAAVSVSRKWACITTRAKPASRPVPT